MEKLGFGFMRIPVMAEQEVDMEQLMQNGRLLHGAWRTSLELDSFNFMIKQKERGLVKHIGMSYHDNAESLDEILTRHPELEIVQLQINYLDWENESIQSRKCYEIARKHGKPVIISHWQ